MTKKQEIINRAKLAITKGWTKTDHSNNLITIKTVKVVDGKYIITYELFCFISFDTTTITKYFDKI